MWACIVTAAGREPKRFARRVFARAMRRPTLVSGTANVFIPGCDHGVCRAEVAVLSGFTGVASGVQVITFR